MNAEIRALAEQYGGVWEDHPDYPVIAWQHEVENGDTRAGYWEWVAGQIEMNEMQSPLPAGSILAGQCISCGRDYRGDDEPLLRCDADDCPSNEKAQA